jgi:precorrin-4/cobalt-precorrin-4 C11-methyltransferase
VKVYFIGAGPGDPKLITVKGQEIIAQADVIIYAGSLVNPEVLNHRKPKALVYNSAAMTLPEVLAVMEEAVANNQTVARVHTGDPSIYGAIKEQMDALEAKNIPYEIIPGVSSFLAAAASLKSEYTLPGISQTVILTRLEGRTPVPEKEKLAGLATHQASMCIFLSSGMIKEVVAQLLTAYPPATPVAVVYKASWPEELIIRGTLATIEEEVKKQGVNKTALILVGSFLDSEYELSRLYDPSFSHEYRRASS